MFAFWFSFRLQSQADGTFSVINYAKHAGQNKLHFCIVDKLG